MRLDVRVRGPGRICNVGDSTARHAMRTNLARCGVLGSGSRIEGCRFQRKPKNFMAPQPQTLCFLVPIRSQSLKAFSPLNPEPLHF